MNRVFITSLTIICFLVLSLSSCAYDLYYTSVEITTKLIKSKTYSDSNYTDTDTLGNKILLLTDIEPSKKREIWKNSVLKEEMLNIFPNYTEMHHLIESRMVDTGGTFKTTLLAQIIKIEEDYISGKITAQHAKAMLSEF